MNDTYQNRKNIIYLVIGSSELYFMNIIHPIIVGYFNLRYRDTFLHINYQNRLNIEVIYFTVNV